MRRKKGFLCILMVAAMLLCSPQILPLRNTETVRYANGPIVSSAADDSFLWPIPGCSHITSFFGYRTIELYGYNRLHTGIDINAGIGTPVIAAESGTVLVSTLDGGYGEYIIIHHGDGLVSVYGHLKSRTVARGDTVSKGDLIGYSGNSGLSSGPHLHFELRINGSPINPFRYTYT